MDDLVSEYLDQSGWKLDFSSLSSYFKHEKQNKTEKTTRKMAFWGLPQVQKCTRSLRLWVIRVGKLRISVF
jgi:hypothetical protein